LQLLPPRRVRGRVQNSALLGTAWADRHLAGDGTGYHGQPRPDRDGHLLHHELATMARPVRAGPHSLGRPVRRRSVLSPMMLPAVTEPFESTRSGTHDGVPPLPISLEERADGDYLALPSARRPKVLLHRRADASSPHPQAARAAV